MNAELEQISSVYRPRGAAWDLFYKFDLKDYQEVLFEGRAGTGKTLAIAMWIHAQALKYPGMKILFVRGTRDSMTNSCMATFEDQVLKVDMPSVCAGRDRSQREHYEYPNGTRIVVCGMNNEDRIMSTEYDVIWLNEATVDITVSQYEKLTIRLRPAGRRVTPYSILLADCNPSFKGHFLNQRFMPDPAAEVKRLRLIGRHEDNPRYYNADGTLTDEGRTYIARLKAMTGASRQRYYEGKWASEEGLVYNEFDPAVHVIRRADLPPIEYYFMSCDWGFRNAGVLQVWGVDSDERMYQVHETYRTQQTVDYWADEAVKLYNEFRPIAIVCDPASPEKRMQFNDRLSRYRYGKVNRIAIEANNDREAGMMEVKSALQREPHAPTCKKDCKRTDPHGRARLYFVDDALRGGRDPLLAAEMGRSVCTTDEIQQLAWLKTKDGREIKEAWDDSISHDGLDAMRYAAMFNWKRHSPKRGKRNPYKAGTPGYRMWEAGLLRNRVA